jgi:hypothetical protein
MVLPANSLEKFARTAEAVAATMSAGKMSAFRGQDVAAPPGVYWCSLVFGVSHSHRGFSPVVSAPDLESGISKGKS